MTMIKRPIVAEAYKPRLKQMDVIKLIKLLNDYRKFPHFTMRDEVIAEIEKMIERYGGSL